jgi:hypothetical protein
MELQDRRFAVTLTSVILGLAVVAMEAPLVSPANLGLLAAALTAGAAVVATLRGLEAETVVVRAK